MSQLRLQPITLREARAFVDLHHRHHRAPQGGLFAVAVGEAEAVVGVAIIGKPVARFNNDGWTAEVTRVAVVNPCTVEHDREHPKDGCSHDACSRLYGAAWRAARALGYRRLLTYTLASERGTSLRAAGWRIVGQTDGGSWSRASRPRVDTHPTEAKTIWEAA
jgi:hypothetical protein